MLPFPAHTEQLDFLDFVRQALECQFYIRLTDEMDLKTETAFQPLLRLGTNHFGGDGFQCLDLCPQSLPSFGLSPQQLRRAARPRRIRMTRRESVRSDSGAGPGGDEDRRPFNPAVAQIVQRLFSTATDAGATGADSIFGQGILNLAAAFAPAGSTSLAGSTVPISVSDNGTLSPAMGDAMTGAATQAVA